MAGQVEIAFGPEFYANPYPTYARLRSADPVHHDSHFGWLVTRHTDFQTLAHDSRLSRAAVEATRSVGVPAEAIRAAEPVLEELRHEVRAKDPPEHVRMRRLLSNAFTPRMVELLRPRIRRLVDDLLDRVAGNRGMDVIRDFAYPLPATVIMELLGIPVADRDQLKVWTDDRVAFLGSISVTPHPLQTAQRAGTSVVRLVAYYSDLIDQRRREPQEDLLSALIGTQEGADGGLTDAEIVANCIFLLSGGHETTTHLIGNGLLALLGHPDQWQLVQQDRSFIPSAVEELLRYDSPVQFVPRAATENVEVGGKRIRPGDRVTFAIGAANRDPEYFHDADRLDVTRTPNDHVAFGFDRHFCLGAHLARVEGQVAFGALLERFPNMRLATEVETLTWQANPAFHGLNALPVRF